MNQKLKDLIDHIRELGNSISSDLETGLHAWNNAASVEFAKKHPALIQWAKDLDELADKVRLQDEDETVPAEQRELAIIAAENLRLTDLVQVLGSGRLYDAKVAIGHHQTIQKLNEDNIRLRQEVTRLMAATASVAVLDVGNCTGGIYIPPDRVFSITLKQTTHQAIKDAYNSVKIG